MRDTAGAYSYLTANHGVPRVTVHVWWGAAFTRPFHIVLHMALAAQRVLELWSEEASVGMQEVLATEYVVHCSTVLDMSQVCRTSLESDALL